MRFRSNKYQKPAIVPVVLSQTEFQVIYGGGGGGHGHSLDTIRMHTAKARLNAAHADFLAVMARVHPTPTYDAVAADLNFDPRLS